MLEKDFSRNIKPVTDKQNLETLGLETEAVLRHLDSCTYLKYQSEFPVKKITLKIPENFRRI